MDVPLSLKKRRYRNGSSSILNGIRQTMNKEANRKTKRDFLKLVLDRFLVSVYFADTSVFSADFSVQSFTERGE